MRLSASSAAFLLVLTGACPTPPSPPDPHGVTPSVVRPGKVVTIFGAHLGPSPEVWIGDQNVQPMRVSQTEITVPVPDDVPSGRHGIRVKTAFGTTSRTHAIEVWRVQTEPPCTKRFALDVSAAHLAEQLDITHLHTDGPPKTTSLYTDLIEYVVLDKVTDARGPCYTARVHLRDGTQHLIADDRNPVEDPVRRLAEALQLELVDADDLPDPAVVVPDTLDGDGHGDGTPDAFKTEHAPEAPGP